VVGGFAHNYTNFHQQASYEFFTDVILRLNTSNPQIGARLVATYNHWDSATAMVSNFCFNNSASWLI
jgi:aminopeptidase N